MPTINFYEEMKCALPTRRFGVGMRDRPITIATESDASVFSNEFTVGATTSVKLMSIGSGLEDDLALPKLIRIRWSAPTSGQFVITWEGTASASPDNTSGLAFPSGYAGVFYIPGYETPAHDDDTPANRLENSIQSITSIYCRNTGSASINVEIDAIE